MESLRRLNARPSLRWRCERTFYELSKENQAFSVSSFSVNTCSVTPNTGWIYDPASFSGARARSARHGGLHQGEMFSKKPAVRFENALLRFADARSSLLKVRNHHIKHERLRFIREEGSVTEQALYARGSFRSALLLERSLPLICRSPLRAHRMFARDR